MKQNSKKVAARVADSLKLPRELLFGEPIVTVTGRAELTIENYKGILDYQPDRIRLSLKRGQIEIHGKTLKIEYYTNDDMRISGRIDRIEYGM